MAAKYGVGGSDLDDFAIVGHFVFDLGAAVEHVVAHVREDDALGADRG